MPVTESHAPEVDTARQLMNEQISLRGLSVEETVGFASSEKHNMKQVLSAPKLL